VSRRDYHRAYYAANKIRRRAQRLASKYKASADWRAFLPIRRQEVA
jgi:hypothetical protein